VADREEAVARLIELANEGGGPDNITCIVADLTDDEPQDNPPFVVGAVAVRD
jgi:protein phosphatase